MKKCRKCEIEKPLSEFVVDKRQSDGRTARCRECKRKYLARKKMSTRMPEKYSDEFLRLMPKPSW